MGNVDKKTGDRPAVQASASSQPLEERIDKSIRLIHREQDSLGKEDMLRMESVLYAFALKFLTEAELSSLEEVFQMTVLGQMLEARGIEKGIEKGINAFISDKLEDGKTEEQILGKLEQHFSLSREAAKEYYDHYIRMMPASDH